MVATLNGQTELASQTTVAAIKTVTDNLPDSGALTTISDETDKIDTAAGTGLSGSDDSLSYAIGETDRHVHHYSRTFGAAAAPSGETHVADEITSDPAPFVVDAGNDTWGTWVQLLGSSDTPSISGSEKFDPHLINIVSAENANVIYLIQLAAGASGAAALTAGTYSDKVFIPQSANGRPAPVPIGIKRQDTGTKVWMRTLARGTNTSELGIYIEIHEYEG